MLTPRVTFFFLLTPVVLLATGCASKLTYDRFQMIEIRMDSQPEVREILGSPDAEFETEWMYDDLDRHVSAVIYFDDTGLVIGKEWMDATRGTFEGDESADQPPLGEMREERRRSRTLDD